MNQFLNRLNLRPQERRLVVGILVVIFVVVNLWVVWPHFGDWGRTKKEIGKVKETLALYQRETDPKRLAEYQKRLHELEGEGSSVLPSERSLDLARAINVQAQQSGVTILSGSEVPRASSGKTNEFFEEKVRRIRVSTGEKELVDFLVSLGSSNSMIRARTMRLSPDPSHMRLQGDIDLIASYQKNPPPLRSTPPPAAKTETTVKPLAVKPKPDLAAKTKTDTAAKTNATAKAKAEAVEKAEAAAIAQAKANAAARMKARMDAATKAKTAASSTAKTNTLPPPKVLPSRKPGSEATNTMKFPSLPAPGRTKETPNQTAK